MGQRGSQICTMPHPARPGPAAAILVPGHPGGLPAREGMVWLGLAAFADVTRLALMETGGGMRGRRVMSVRVGDVR
jgi:hypothetical protein